MQVLKLLLLSSSLIYCVAILPTFPRRLPETLPSSKFLWAWVDEMFGANGCLTVYIK